MGVGVIRVELDGLAIGGDRLGQVLLLKEGVAEAVITFGVVRIDLDRLAV